MKMPKPTDADKEMFRSLLPKSPDVSERPMFGQLAGFVNGNMFICLFGDRIALKLPDDGAAELMAFPGAGPFEPMAGRPMRGYVALPADWHDQPEHCGEWINRSLEYVASLPPKTKKAAKKVTKPSQKG